MQRQINQIQMSIAQKQEKQNLLGQTIAGNQEISNPSNEINEDSLQKTQIQKKQEQEQVINPIEQLLKKNNIMPLLSIIDQVDLNRKIQDKPLISILATKFIPLNIILKDRQISFQCDQDRRTPLHYAIQANDVKAAAWLIEKGNPNQQDNYGNTPILDAIRLGRRRCFLLCLKSKYYDERSPIFASMYNRHWQLKILHGMKVDIFNYRDQQNKSSFQRALQYCSFDCAQFMIKIKPDLNIQKSKHLTDSKGLIRKLKRIQKQQSPLNKVKQALKPILLLLALYVGLNANSYGIAEVFPYQDTKPLHLIVILLICGLYGLMYFFGSVCKSNVDYTQKNTLSHILMEPDYHTLQDICPICVHFTDFIYDHCYSCGNCVQKYHFHSFVCVNKANQVFWVLVQVVWLYLTGSILHQFNQYLTWSSISISTTSSWKVIRFFSSLELLYQENKFISIAWILFLWFLFLYQIFICLTILGMMSMRRKYPEVISSEKYPHLYDIVKFEDNYLSREKKVFKRGFIGGLSRCVRNCLVYFFVQY